MEMELKTSACVQIIDGVGTLDFPEALKFNSKHSYIRCRSICYESNLKSENKPLFVVCSSSYHLARNYQRKKNILAMFNNAPTGGLIHYDGDNNMPITSPQTVMDIELVDCDGMRQNVTAVAVFEIQGIVKDNFVNI